MTRRPRVVVVGAGRMGRGITMAYLLNGYRIVLLDLRSREPEGWDRLRHEVEREIREDHAALAELGIIAPDRQDEWVADVSVASVGEAAEVLAGADLVYEAVPETQAAKREALGVVGSHARPDAVIASTTSTILATDLARMLDRPERFLNAHWLNPAFVVPLVEISPHPTTSDEVVTEVREHLESIGKVPVVCGASPGYIVPRLQALIMNEAARMVAEGTATAEDIDLASRYGLGFRFASMGVLEFVDYGGNDTLYHASTYLAGAVDGRRYEVPEIVSRFMAGGRNGLRDGRGFHEYPPSRRRAYRADVLSRLVAMLRHVGKVPGHRA